MADANRLIRLGVAVPLAKEFERQFGTGAGNVNRTINVGLPALAAKTVADQIAGGANADRLCRAGVPSVVAREISAQIDQGGNPVVMLTPPTATPETVTVGDNTTLTLGTYSNATSVVGVLMQGGIDRTGEIVDGVWSPGVEGAATWTVTASGAGGPIVTVVDITVEAIAPL